MHLIRYPYKENYIIFLFRYNVRDKLRKSPENNKLVYWIAKKTNTDILK